MTESFIDTASVTPVTRKGRTHTIVRTYLNARGVFTKATTGVVGGTDKEALYLYRNNVRHARVNKNLFAVVLVTAAGEQLAEWSRADETAVA